MPLNDRLNRLAFARAAGQRAAVAGVGTGRSGLLKGVLAAGLLCAVYASWATPGIYTCVDASGKRRTADRPIPECLDREQRVLNKDGSQRKLVAPRQTPQERAAAEDLRRQRLQAEMAQKDAIRRDRNLLFRYPNEAAHQKAREAALDDIRKAIASSEKRVADLQAERRPLLADAEFYKGKALPFKLRIALEGNETSQGAQREIIENQRAEMVRINAMYDVELNRLKKLWAGAEPGSFPESAPVSTPVSTPVAAVPASAGR